MRLIHSTSTRLSFWLLPLCLAWQGCSDDVSEATMIDEPPALLIAAENGDLPTLTKLIEGDTTAIDVKDACFWTPLMKAALNGHTKAVERLIVAGADVNQKDKGGYSSLMLAASNNHPDIIDLLIKAGADINQVEMTKGWTALIWASKQGHKEAVERLLAYQADQSIADFSGKRAMDWAKENHFQEIASLLQ
ncbi:MAG: ankyrin repeat domain-containing protein [Candidatus Thiodiazotropha sp.]|jgi:ankyrin repeat protein